MTARAGPLLRRFGGRRRRFSDLWHGSVGVGPVRSVALMMSGKCTIH